MSAESDHLDLTSAVIELREKYGCSTNYHKLWRAVVEGRVPAVRLPSRQWQIRRADMPAAVAAFQPAVAA